MKALGNLWRMILGGHAPPQPQPTKPDTSSSPIPPKPTPPVYRAPPKVHKPFAPHHSKELTRMELMGGTKPQITISPEAFTTMYYLVEMGAMEVGWFCTVERQGSTFRLEKVYVPRQEVSGVVNRFSAEKMSNFLWEEFLKDKAHRKEGKILVSKLLFWGHSHVWMGVSPSGQDIHQMENIFEACDRFFIRGIFNKSGQADFSLYLVNGEWPIVINHVPWRAEKPFVPDQEEKERVRLLLDERVTSLHSGHTLLGSGPPDPVYPMPDMPDQDVRGIHVWDVDQRDTSPYPAPPQPQKEEE